MRGRVPLFHAHCGAHNMTSPTYRRSTDATSQEEVPYTIWRSLTTLAGVLMRDRRGRFRCKVRKNSHVKRSRDQRGSCKLGCWGQPATTGTQNRYWLFPEASGRSMTPLAASLWTLEPPELWKNKLLLFKMTQIAVICYGYPGKWI